MPPRDRARIRIEATTAPDSRPVVHLYVNGLRFALDAPSPERARQIVFEVALSLGLEDVDG